MTEKKQPDKVENAFSIMGMIIGLFLARGICEVNGWTSILARYGLIALFSGLGAVIFLGGYRFVKMLTSSSSNKNEE